MKRLDLHISLILALSLLCVVTSYAGEMEGSSDMSSYSPSLSIALSRVRLFSPAGSLKLLGTQRRYSNAPFVQCYKFIVPLSASQGRAGGSSENTGQAFEAIILAEKDTGRIVEYKPDMNYILLKRQGSPNIAAVKRVSETQAEEIAQTILKNAGIIDPSIRLSSLVLSKQPAYAVYDVNFEKYTNYSGIGEIQLPFSAFLTIDAETGSVDYYGLKEYPVTIKLTKPSITKEQAIKAVVKKLGITSIESSSAHLAVAFDYRGISDEAVDLSISNPQAFYEQFSKSRQVLVWRIQLKGKCKANWSKTEVIDLNTDANVNAFTGQVISALMP